MDPRPRGRREILDRIAALPGVDSAAFTDQLPMEDRSNYGRIIVEGRPLAAGEMAPPFRIKLVSPGYFETMGTRLIAGRDVSWSDLDAGGHVAVVSEAFGSLARTSFTLVMLAIAGGMALLLGIVGIYAVVAYIVSQRTREIGIRSALGAEPGQLKKMFLLHGIALSGVGAIVPWPSAARRAVARHRSSTSASLTLRARGRRLPESVCRREA